MNFCLCKANIPVALTTAESMDCLLLSLGSLCYGPLGARSGSDWPWLMCKCWLLALLISMQFQSDRSAILARSRSTLNTLLAIFVSSVTIPQKSWRSCGRWSRGSLSETWLWFILKPVNCIDSSLAFELNTPRNCLLRIVAHKLQLSVYKPSTTQIGHSDNIPYRYWVHVSANAYIFIQSMLLRLAIQTVYPIGDLRWQFMAHYDHTSTGNPS